MTDDANVLHLHRAPLYPPSSGEEVRVWKTSEKLTEFGTVRLAHPTENGVEPAAGIRPVDTDNVFLEHKATRIYAWNAFLGVSPDNAFERLQSRRTVRSLDGFDAGFDLVCCENPQMLRAGHRLARRYDAPLLLNKHNAMFDLLDQQLETRPVPKPLRRRAVENLRTLEQRGIDAADAVVFQSADDRERFRVPDDTLVEVIPNGTDLETIERGGDPERVRERLGIPDSATVCLFVGACDYEPNAAAANVIIEELAPALPDVEFLVVGRSPPTSSRRNVHAPGFVEDLPGVLSLADVAVCPLTLGSGTKLKMMDYLAAGLPTVTTEVGAQGIPVEDGRTALIRDVPDGFVDAIESLRESESLRSELAAEARKLGREFGWESRLERYDPLLRELLD